MGEILDVIAARDDGRDVLVIEFATGGAGPPPPAGLAVFEIYTRRQYIPLLGPAVLGGAPCHG